MKLYRRREELSIAMGEADSGMQSLFIHSWVGGPEAPVCFRGLRMIGKLFDNDCVRLEQTAKRLGVKKIKIDRRGKAGQHVDLVGRPLQKAMQLA